MDRWRKSSRSSGGDDANCVEVALEQRHALVRDSKNTGGPTLTVPSWAGFLAAVKRL